MAELIITLRRIAGSVRAFIRVALRSDDDVLPHEHEQDHRRLVAGLFPSLQITDDPEAPIQVQREKPLIEPILG
jgi:hypothetical protein